MQADALWRRGEIATKTKKAATKTPRRASEKARRRAEDRTRDRGPLIAPPDPDDD